MGGKNGAIVRARAPLLVRRLARGTRAPHRTRGRGENPHPAERGKMAGLLLPSLEAERRGAGRGADLHLHAQPGPGRADQPLGRARGDVREALRHVQGRDAGQDDVRRALPDGPARLAAVEGRRRAHRFALRGAEHADHDAHGRRSRGATWAGAGTSTAGSIACSISIPSAATSPIFRRTTRSSPSARTTAATCCWGRNASRCASAPTWRGRRAGWPSTC